MDLASRLKNRIEVWGKVEFENELEELDYRYEKIKSVWSEILPTGGVLKTTEDNSVYADVSHKITIRNNSIPNLANDMYFIYNNQRFDIKFFQPNYKFNDSIEIFCSLIIQNTEDLGGVINE